MIRTVTKSAARRRRRTPEGATPSQEGVEIKDSRAIWRAVHLLQKVPVNSVPPQ
jgi:hypothetical protein